MKCATSPRCGRASRSRGTEPALTLVTISGPYGTTSSGDSPSRRRIFTCATRDDACARRILLALTRRAYRRPTTDADVQDLLPFYDEGTRGSRIRSGHPAGARTPARQSAIPVPDRERTGDCDGRRTDQRSRTRVASLVLSLEQHPRRAAPERRRAGTARIRRPSSNAKCGGCCATGGRHPSSPTSPNSGCSFATSRPNSPTVSSSPTSTKRCARPCARRPICSSTASCARTAASSTC